MLGEVPRDFGAQGLWILSFMSIWETRLISLMSLGCTFRACSELQIPSS